VGARRSSAQWHFVLLLAIGLGAAGANAQPTPGVESVWIEDGWRSPLDMSSPHRVEVTIRCHGGACIAKIESGPGDAQRRVPPYPVAAADVRRLVAAMEAPALPVPDARLIGYTDAEIKAAIDAVVPVGSFDKAPGDVRAKLAAIRTSLHDQRGLSEALREGFASMHPDDFPHSRVEIRLTNGRRLTAHAGSQHALLLPWTNQDNIATYAPELPRAVAALLPKDAPNRDRLQRTRGLDLEMMLNEALGEQLVALDAEAFAAPALARLRKQFLVDRVVRSHNAAEKRDDLHVLLHRRGEPANFGVNGLLTAHDGMLDASSDAALARFPLLLDRALAAPGMAERIAAKPASRFMVFDESAMAEHVMDARTARQFVEQMHAIGKLRKLDADSPQLKDALLVVEDGLTFWVVLPDRRAILWKKFDPSSKDRGRRCAGIPLSFDSGDAGIPYPLDNTCIGELHGSDGKLEP
jgi:hypothetical protein